MTVTEFEEIARRIRPMLCREAADIVGDGEAEDIAQDVLLKMWKQRDRLYRYANIDGAARVAARRAAIDRLRRRHPEAELPQELPGDGGADSFLLRDEDERNLDRVLAQLSSTQRAILQMKHVEMLETSEIARILGSSKGSVRTALSRARHKVKDIFLNSKQ